jgi:NADPH-dependent 2,4-dienoyl-CoA reductase/sulfur reductase-like enzyme
VLNPVVGFERDYAHLPRTNSPKNILVIGAGIAGLEASIVAAERGHRVTLAEKNTWLGGQIHYASSAPYKAELKNIVTFYEHQIKELDVDIRLNLQVDRKTISELNPDIAIMATGAIPVTPPISGMNNSNVFMAQDVLANPSIIKDGPIAVVGGGALGAEVTEIFAMQEFEVTLIEMKGAIAEDMGLMLALSFHERFDKYSVTTITRASVNRIEDGKVHYRLSNGKVGYVSAACVVLATGYSANRALENDLNELVSEVILIGDCQAPRKIINAIHEGFHAARLIE